MAVVGQHDPGGGGGPQEGANGGKIKKPIKCPFRRQWINMSVNQQQRLAPPPPEEGAGGNKSQEAVKEPFFFLPHEHQNRRRHQRRISQTERESSKPGGLFLLFLFSDSKLFGCCYD